MAGDRKPGPSSDAFRAKPSLRLRDQPFTKQAVLKRRYGYRRVRCRALVRNALQLQLLAVALNLRRALVLAT